MPTISKRAHALTGKMDDEVLYLEGRTDREWAWLDLFEDRYEMDEGYPFYFDIASRGDDLFCALVCYSLLKVFGETLYDDAGYLEAGREFTLDVGW